MPHPTQAEVLQALNTGAAIFGERHKDPAARNMAVACIHAKKVRWLLVEALEEETNQREVLAALLDGHVPNVDQGCWTPMTLQPSGDWLPVINACYQQRTPIVFADFSPTIVGKGKTIRLKPESPDGMTMRNEHMAGKVNLISSIRFPGTTRGQGVLLVCGNSHVAGVMAGVKDFPIAGFDFT